MALLVALTLHPHPALPLPLPGGHLATIDSLAMAEHVDAKFVGRASNQCRSLWIGYSDRAAEGNWVWADGLSETFTN